MTNKCCGGEQFVLCLVAIILSPLAALISRGCSKEFALNILLFILGVLPGIIHAWYLILSGGEFKRLLLTLLGFILPPLSVGIKVGCTKHLIINILLTILGFLPGIIHCIYILWFRRNMGLLGGV